MMKKIIYCALFGESTEDVFNHLLYRLEYEDTIEKVQERIKEEELGRHKSYEVIIIVNEVEG